MKSIDLIEIETVLNVFDPRPAPETDPQPAPETDPQPDTPGAPRPNWDDEPS